MKYHKRLGQHILRDREIINDIVCCLDSSYIDNIVEIGPGSGALSNIIQYEDFNSYTMIEKDSRFIDHLKTKLGKNQYYHSTKHYDSTLTKPKGITIIEGDFLNVNLSLFNEYNSVKFFGNLPYNVSVPIIFKVIEYGLVHNNVSECIFMLQYEVAKKILLCNKSRIAPALHYACTISQIGKIIQPSSFIPAPKVKSAIISMVFNHNTSIETFNHIKAVSKILFTNKRKKLKSKMDLLRVNNTDISDKRIDEISYDDIFDIAMQSKCVSISVE